eukprot:CAMPEP_0168468694 /NCGR_PEP_ID=MMETSP0228-20121227/57836_1 /TAXON_ID=133427 /ORGANISM="Protoceratium reticulatum, Strain CCCM 535 (=CCMP 1889)" /LENGTH=50 /DNA_ID=CAMNT_0008484455 /DNA_START=132 /DNA_END=281 /DNA_ORIENTATION=+
MRSHVLLMVAVVVQHCDRAVVLHSTDSSTNPAVVHLGEDLNMLSHFVAMP